VLKEQTQQSGKTAEQQIRKVLPGRLSDLLICCSADLLLREGKTT